MQTIQQEVIIHASKEAVRNVLFSEFIGSDVRNPTIQRFRHSNETQGEVGCERECNISSKASIHERISATTPNDSCDFDVVGVPMVDGMNRMFTKTTVAVKYHIETGTTVSSSNIKGIVKTCKSLEPTASFTQAQ